MSQHPCRGKTDVSMATCWSFNESWRDRDGPAGLLRRQGLSYGAAFLRLYLPDVTDDELTAADDARAWEIVQARYVANRRPGR